MIFQQWIACAGFLGVFEFPRTFPALLATSKMFSPAGDLDRMRWPQSGATFALIPDEVTQAAKGEIRVTGGRPGRFQNVAGWWFRPRSSPIPVDSIALGLSKEFLMDPERRSIEIRLIPDPEKKGPGTLEGTLLTYNERRLRSAGTV